MARVLRGEIRWADLNPTVGRVQSGRRPVLILRQKIFNNRSGTVVALALTSQSQSAEFPLTYELKSGKHSKRSWVKISQIRTLAVHHIGKKIDHAEPEELLNIIDGLNEIIGA